MNKFAKIIGAAMVVLMPLGAMAPSVVSAASTTGAPAKAKKSDGTKAKTKTAKKKTPKKTQTQ